MPGHNIRIPTVGTSRPPPPLGGAKVAIVHEWLYTYAGAEKVLEQILGLFPSADIFSLIDFLPPEQRDFLGGRSVHTSFLQKMPFIGTKHQLFLPFMPLAMERFDLSSYDVIVTSSYAVAKGVITGPNQLHLCYCHSPVRYAWDLQHQYLHQWRIDRGPKAIAATWILHKLRIWDHVTSNGVDQFISNSRFVARRIWKTYRRKSIVVYPPVDTAKFTPQGERGDEYITISRLVGYKRIDLLIDAFRARPDRKLAIIGQGEDLEKLRASAPANVRVLGGLPHDQLVATLRKAKAFLFAAEEDFGIAPVEAQACGVPVIAYGRGGALETVRGVWAGETRPWECTGVFFPRQDVESLLDAIQFFESRQELFRSSTCVENAHRFAPHVFRREFMKVADSSWKTAKERERNPNLDWED
jgi:glycosyltransferase involved in cell wall biosynthesis